MAPKRLNILHSAFHTANLAYLAYLASVHTQSHTHTYIHTYIHTHKQTYIRIALAPFKEVWSKRKRDMVFGSNFNPLASMFTGFSVCYPLYDDSVMLNMVRHAIYSSFSTDSATATFLLLPISKGLNANAYMQMLRKYQEHCTILGTIPQASVTYRRQYFWIGNTTSSPAPEWDLEIFVIWNKKSQHILFDQNPRWCAALSNAIPKAIFQPCPHPPTQNVA